MFKKVKEWVASIKKKKQQKIEMENMKDYYEKLRNGALFVQYIYKDMAEQKKKMNRPQRRRVDVELSKKGKFSEEVIKRYMAQITDINVYFAEQKEKLQKTIVSELVKKELAQMANEKGTKKPNDK